MKVALLPLGPVPEDLLDPLLETLTACGIACDTRGPGPLPPEAFVPSRRQWDAEPILRGLPKSSSETVVAVTDADLFVEGLHFVFGLADAFGGVVLVSVARLRSRDPAVTQRRLLTEVVHELGHTLGMAHCPDAACVQHFSNSLEDTDAKGAAFCPACEAHLPAEASEPFAKLRIL
ncbi:MAG: peptidase zinc-dependent [Candidatus Thermoplasmatota archaeon]